MRACDPPGARTGETVTLRVQDTQTAFRPQDLFGPLRHHLSLDLARLSPRPVPIGTLAPRADSRLTLPVTWDPLVSTAGTPVAWNVDPRHPVLLSLLTYWVSPNTLTAQGAWGIFVIRTPVLLTATGALHQLNPIESNIRALRGPRSPACWCITSHYGRSVLASTTPQGRGTARSPPARLVSVQQFACGEFVRTMRIVIAILLRSPWCCHQQPKKAGIAALKEAPH